MDCAFLFVYGKCKDIKMHGRLVMCKKKKSIYIELKI